MVFSYQYYPFAFEDDFAYLRIRVSILWRDAFSLFCCSKDDDITLSDKEQNIVAFLIGQLGRDTSYSKDVLDGKRMLQDCYDLIGSARDLVGGRLILLKCKPIEELCKYYEEEGYIDITENDDGLKQYVRFID